MTTALLIRLTHHCDIVETGDESWRSKTAPDLPKDGSSPTRARPGCVTPTSFEAGWRKRVEAMTW